MLKLYSIKDVKGAYSEPFTALNDSIAARNVKTLVNGQKGSQYALYPEDFELWVIGDYDELIGLVTPCEAKCICRLIALKDEVNA